MCGIVAVFRRNPIAGSNQATNKKMINFVKSALTLSQVRGIDSSGLVLINESFKVTYNMRGQSSEGGGLIKMFRSPEPVEKFLSNEKTIGMFDEVHDWTTALIGHTRNSSSATAKNNKNNHPHKVGKIIGVHNGNISNYKNLIKKYDLNLNGKCDSEVIFGLLDKFIQENKLTMKEAIKKTTSLLEGSFAVIAVHTDKLGKYMVFKRNAPLHLKYKTAGQILMITSTPDILDRAIIGAKIEYSSSQSTYSHKSDFYLTADSVYMPDNCAYIFDDSDGTTDDWVKKSKPFMLS